MDSLKHRDLKDRGISHNDTFEAIAERHLSRRMLLKGAAAMGAVAGLPSLLSGEAKAQSAPQPLSFEGLGETRDDTITVPAGYRADVVIQWGDALFPNMPAFDIYRQTGADAARRFGFNNDMVALFPEPYGAPAQIGGRLPYPSYLMCVNHEYVTGAYEFPDYPNVGSRDTAAPKGNPTRNQVEAQIESLGVSVVNIKLVDGRWRPDINSPYNRRITGTTPIEITGPVRGDTLVQTPADPSGTLVRGTFANCAGGQTPWGTYLTCEENWDGLFNNLNGVTDPNLKALHSVWPFFNAAATVSNPSSITDFTLLWELYDSRFDLSKPEGVKEPFRFGYVVEIDPYDPTSRPKKRSALGRFKHEAAQTVRTADDRIAVYSGDDETFEYAYKFVTSGRYNPNDRAANMNLLDSGTLYVAKFNDNGTGQWLPLDFATLNTLAPGKFRNQADVILRTREAADVVGATPMDRPEDFEAPHDDQFRGTGRVFLVCTNNSSRGSSGRPGTDMANPRVNNRTGQIIEIVEANNDHAATSFRWSIFLLAGDPGVAATSNITTIYNGVQTVRGARFGSPDNIAFDKGGNLFIATDGNASTFTTLNDQVLTVATTGTYPRDVKRFLVGPREAEICGPTLTPDNTTFFCAIQHPGENGTLVDSPTNPKLRRTSSWPNGGTNAPRSAVVAVRREDGGRIGS